jgi:UV DNA damage endonuclease
MSCISDTQKNNLVLGYCCINTILRKRDIFCSRTCRLATIKEKGIEYSYELAHKNLDDLVTILKWNHLKKIYNYRMSSDMFPFSSHQDYYLSYDWEQFRPKLRRIGKIAKKYSIRLNFHPGQFNVISSHNENTVVKSIIEIDIHSKIMDIMKLDNDSTIVIHGGSKNGGKELALTRFKINFKRLSESSKKRLVLENCEMMYSIEDLLPVSEELIVPIVVDSHHHNINSGTLPFSDLIGRVLVIWNKRNITPLFHVSQSRSGVLKTDSITKRRAHSDYVTVIPIEFLNVTKNHKLYIDIEAKCKELSVIYLQKKYFMI